MISSLKISHSSFGLSFWLFPLLSTSFCPDAGLLPEKPLKTSDNHAQKPKFKKSGEESRSESRCWPFSSLASSVAVHILTCAISRPRRIRWILSFLPNTLPWLYFQVLPCNFRETLPPPSLPSPPSAKIQTPTVSTREDSALTSRCRGLDSRTLSGGTRNAMRLLPACLTSILVSPPDGRKHWLLLVLF